MKIWLLKSRLDDYQIFNCTNDADQEMLSANFKGVPIENWVPPHLEIYQDGKESDITVLLSVPIFSVKAVEVVRSLFREHVQLLPLLTNNGKEYLAGNVVNVLDCIDGERAEVKRLRSGKIMKYIKYAFVEKLVKEQDIFKVVNHESKRTIVTKIFVSDRFREKVLESGLVGFDFIEVWDSNESKTVNAASLPNDFSLSEETFTFEEALSYLDKHQETLYSDKWAIRYVENRELEVGQVQNDGTYSWVKTMYYPPIFLDIKWRKKA